MAAKTTLGTFWHMPDDLWALIAPVVGPGKAAGTVGRPPRPFRQIFDGILYVLCTGCQWHALPRRVYGPRLHCARSFHPVGAIRMFYEAWQRVLAYSDGAIGIDWKWQALDGVITKAPLGGDAIGPNPVD